MNRWLILFGLLLLVGVLPVTGLFLDETVLVERVVDGDTLVLEGGERVRLIGIDTPERGQHLFDESTAFVRDLVEGRRVRLERDMTERDKYDRLLRYVYIGDRFLNLELVREGYATALNYEPDSTYRDLFALEEARVRQLRKGIWIFPPEDFCLGIFSLHANAKGDDRGNLNDEYVILRNKCTYSLQLQGWTLRDQAGATFTFPLFQLGSKQMLTLHTGSGSSNQTALFWGRGRPVWNNDGDVLLMTNPAGERMLRYAF